eukprot:snap_masked-scaffold_15-processed-gene-10.0-mRNA-1 protein AED:0.99 eAED:1.00 QI:0/-1/0/1/-1/1/1/0/407
MSNQRKTKFEDLDESFQNFQLNFASSRLTQDARSSRKASSPVPLSPRFRFDPRHDSLRLTPNRSKRFLVQVSNKHIQKQKKRSLNTIRPLSRPWFNFYRKKSPLDWAISPAAEINVSLLETLSPYRKSTTEQKPRYASNCNCVIGDPKLQNIFSPTASIERESSVTCRGSIKPLKSHVSSNLVLRSGVLTLFDSSNFPIFQTNIYDIKRISYQGQNYKVISVKIYLRTDKSWTKGHEPVQTATIAIQFETEKEAKVWISILLFELERMGDTVTACLKNMLSVYQVDKPSKMEFPHVECLLRRRIKLYQLSKLPDSGKLNEARFMLAEFLKAKNRDEEAELYLDAVENYFAAQELAVAEDQGVNEFLGAVTPLTEIDLIKQEIKLFSVKQDVRQLEKKLRERSQNLQV